MATDKNIQAYSCLCQEYHGGRGKRIEVIREHHTLMGKDPFMTKSIIGGMWVEDISLDNHGVDGDLVVLNGDVVGDHDVDNNIHNAQVQDPIGRVNIPFYEYHDI